MRDYVVLRYSPAASPLWVLCDEDAREQAVGRVLQTGLFRLAEHMEVPGTAVPCPLAMGDAQAWVIDGVDCLVGVTSDIAKAETGALACEDTYSVDDFLVHINWPDVPPLDEGGS